MKQFKFYIIALAAIALFLGCKQQPPVADTRLRLDIKGIEESTQDTLVLPGTDIWLFKSYVDLIAYISAPEGNKPDYFQTGKRLPNTRLVK